MLYWSFPCIYFVLHEFHWMKPCLTIEPTIMHRRWFYSPRNVLLKFFIPCQPVICSQTWDATILDFIALELTDPQAKRCATVLEMCCWNPFCRVSQLFVGRTILDFIVISFCFIHHKCLQFVKCAIEAVFRYRCPDILSCPANAIQMGQAA